MDTNAVLRHRQTILACLHDGDISIRRRALELCYALINAGNVRVVVKELLLFLEAADNEFKLSMTTEISLAAERFAPDKRWHIDTVLRTLKLAGNYVREEILSAFIRLVCHTPELQAYTVQKLYLALLADISQESLTLAATWLIGEFGDVLLDNGVAAEGEAPRAVAHADVVDLLLSVLHSPYSNALSSQFVLTALVKLSARFAEVPSAGGQAQIDRIADVLRSYEGTQELELQQRAVEYGSLLQLAEIRAGVLERMPPPEIRATIMGTVSEKRSVGSTKTNKDTVRRPCGLLPLALSLTSSLALSAVCRPRPARRRHPVRRQRLAEQRRAFGLGPADARPARRHLRLGPVVGRPSRGRRPGPVVGPRRHHVALWRVGPRAVSSRAATSPGLVVVGTRRPRLALLLLDSVRRPSRPPAPTETRRARAVDRRRRPDRVHGVRQEWPARDADAARVADAGRRDPDSRKVYGDGRRGVHRRQLPGGRPSSASRSPALALFVRRSS